MPNNILYLVDPERSESGNYAFTITTEPDADYYKYLARKLRGHLPAVPERRPADARPMDISLDDIEGDVMGGLAAVMARGTLHIDMLWVDDSLRRYGLGRRLVQMAEELAAERGCRRVRVRLTDGVAFFMGLDYTVTGEVRDIASGETITFLCKELEQQQPELAG